MGPQATDNIVPREMLALLSNERLIVRETQRAVTSFGGIVVFLEFLERIDLVGQIRRHMPIRWRSHNQIEPASTLVAFLMAVLVGAKRFVHANWLRGDQALHALLGLTRFPTDDTIRNLFRRFGMGEVHQLYAPLSEWQRERLPVRADVTAWIWIRLCLSAMDSRKARSKATTRASMVVRVIILC